MKQRTFYILFAVLLCLSCYIPIFPVANAYSSERLSFSDSPAAIAAASESVVLLECLDKYGNLYCTGSAFSLFDDGIFITNYHVIESDVECVIAYSESGSMFEIEDILAYDEDKDIAILKTNAQTDIRPLSYDADKKLLKGEKIVAIGSPLGFINTVSTGIISGLNKTDAINEILFSASISEGSSGGALFDDNGYIIGMTYGSYKGGQNLNAAIPIAYVTKLYENRTSSISVLEFREEKKPTIFTVDYVLKNRESIDGERGILVGYVADFDKNMCSIVSNPIYIKRGKFSNPDNLNSDDTKEQLYLKNRKSFAINLAGVSSKVFTGLKIGDAIQVKVQFKSIYNIEYYTIVVHDRAEISVM